MQDALNNKVNQAQFNDLNAQVESNTANITLIYSNINNLASDLNTLNSQINGPTGISIRVNALEESNASKISSPQVLSIRQVGLALEYTTDGQNWIPVSSAGTVEWRRYYR